MPIQVNTDTHIVGHEALAGRLRGRLEGRQPGAVTEPAATVEQAVLDAADKLVRRIDGVPGRTAGDGRAPPPAQPD